MSVKQPDKGKSARKSAKTASPRTKKPALIRQANGRGALLSGGMPGNRGGSGRPPSVVRKALLGSIADRVPVLEQIMDGEPMQRTDVPFLELLKYASCPACKGKLKSDITLEDALLLTIEGKVSASPRDRISAYDTAAKYGLGALKDVSQDEVRESLEKTLDVLQELTDPELYRRILKELKPIWSGAK